MDTRESLCDILGFKSTPNLGKYLGFPLKHRGGNNQDQNFILDRVKQKLAGWKANLLSLAGRTVLIQASTSTIPAYVMQCTALPKKLLDDIDRVNRNFLWGSSDSLKRTHGVGWHKVTKAKEQGGLGIQSARGRNQVLLAKLNWRFRTEKDAVWAKVLRSKYCTSRRLHARAKDKLPCSRVWKAIQKGSEVFHKGTRWILGQNSSLSIWHDKWFVEAPLRALIQGPLLEEEERLQVKEVFGPHGWDWSKVSVQVPNDVIMEINAMPFSLGTSIEEDRLIWNGDKHGDFELKSAYSLATRCSEEEEEFMGCWVWKVDTLPRIKSFMWQCLHNSIGVGDCLVKRHLSEMDRCPICLREVETIIHRLRDCEMAKTTWTSLGVQPNSSFFEDSLHIWLEKNCKDHGCRVPN